MGSAGWAQDPAFAAKLRDVVGRYHDPPAYRLVPSVDGRREVADSNALFKPGSGSRPLPAGALMKKGRETMTHDHIRHGTTTLFDLG
jgi:hypothetical protein